MTPQEIADRLTAVHTALVEKTVEQPFVPLTLKVDGNGRCTIGLYRSYNGGDYSLGTASSDTFSGAFDCANAIVAALPSPKEAGIRRYMAQVAKTVEVGRDEGIPDEYVVPFRAVLTAMTENLLPAPEATE